MRTSTATAVLLAAGVYAVGLVRHEVHERRRQELTMAEMHQRLCADTATDFPDEYGYGDLSPTDRSAFIHANRTLSLVGVKYRVGQLSDRTLEVVAKAMMRRPSMQMYWAQNGSLRDQESQDRVDRRFHTIVDKEYADAQGRAK
ncbi:DUF6082 family protein [Streptomyces bauhiniae]|uniref:DUF6082 family protein n=1 Tax=Streptomyces bauhiniae TaxID=2340725 RepID=UPI00332C6B7F